MLDTQNCLQKHAKNAKATKFFYSQHSTLPKEALANFYLSTTNWFKFYDKVWSPTRTSTSYAYLISKIGNSKLNYKVLFYRHTLTSVNIAPKLQKCWTHKIAFEIILKMLMQPDLFCSHPSTLPKDSPAKFHFSTTFGLSFMVSSVAPTRSSTF